MHDDEAMDRLLRGAFAEAPPRLPARFKARVLRRVRTRRLRRGGRLVLAAYGAVSVGVCLWTMRDLAPAWIAAAATLCAAIAAGSAAYGRRLSQS